MNQAQLLEAIQQALADTGPEDAITTAEMADHLMAEHPTMARRQALKQVREAIVQMRKDGTLELVKVRRRSPVDDRMFPVAGYRMLSKQEA